MDSIRAFLEAVAAFGERLAAVRWDVLAVAVALSLLNLVLRSRAWQAIVSAALDGGERLPYRTAFGAYCAGVGVNAVIPARAGDIVKLYLVRRRAPRASYPTLAGTLLAETLFDMLAAGALLIWALQAGVLPGVRLPRIPAFDLSLALRNPEVTLAILGALLVAVLLAAGSVRAFWQQFGRGLTIVRTPWRYLRKVVAYQALGWGCRIAAAACFLAAFSIPATLENALIVQVAGSLGGLLPATPGGLGPTQALSVVMLAGEAGRTDVLAFSAGMELTLLVANAALGLTCLALMVRSLRVGRAVGRARSDRGAAPEG